jgi:pilus assembly protein Flp/PilA
MAKRRLQRVADLSRDQAGQDLVEYALVASLIGLVTVAAMSSVNAALVAMFTKLTSALSAPS